jgi:hypothetical protein
MAVSKTLGVTTIAGWFVSWGKKKDNIVLYYIILYYVILYDIIL